MGFNKVYKALQEIFPQVDARLLRAVAIEHNKDVDAAVEIVLAEIIPFFTEQPRPRTPSIESNSNAIATTQIAHGTSVNVTNSQNENQQSFHDANDGLSEPLYDNCNGRDEEGGDVAKLTEPENNLGDSMQANIGVESYVEYEGDCNSAKLTLLESVLGNGMQMIIDVNSHDEAGQSIDKDSAKAHQIVSGGPKTSEMDSKDKYPDSSINDAYDEMYSNYLAISQDKDNETVDFSHLMTQFDSSTDEEGDRGKSYEDGNYSVVGPAALTNHEPATHSLESDPQLPVMQDKSGSGLEESGVSLPGSSVLKMETVDDVGNEDESTLNASLSQSSQSNIVDVLEEIISDARNNKKTLFSSMQSVISLLREVELKEEAAEQAKVEIAMGGSDILVKTDELKEMVQKAEEANAMYSGEVYGEKAILGTELRELQSRVLSLSDERNKSLAVLNEMQQTLEVRLTEAENEIKSAVQEKVEKEKAAMEALAHQELIMEKVVQESKLLKQQAEDNAKLREFLMDRGRVVDMLQGEIGVICHDVRLLKENFDEQIPFSKSLSSSQTSCILASSTSSSKTLIPDLQLDVDLLQTQKERSPNHHSSEDVDRKELLDEGWELFDNQEIYS